MSGSIIVDVIAVQANEFDAGPLRVVEVGSAIGLRMGDAVFCSRDGKRWHRVHVVTRREARKNAVHLVHHVARYWRITLYGRNKPKRYTKVQGRNST